MILTRRSLADALREDGEYDAAMAELVTCRESLRQDHDDQWEGEVLHSMGLVHLVQQDVAPGRRSERDRARDSGNRRR